MGDLSRRESSLVASAIYIVCTVGAHCRAEHAEDNDRVLFGE